MDVICGWPPKAERREFIRSVLRQFLAICAEREDVNSGADALDEEALTSVLVLAIHQLTYARFSPDRLFADEDQGGKQCFTYLWKPRWQLASSSLLMTNTGPVR